MCFFLICFIAYQCNYIFSLFSLETASIFYSEEDDLRSWFYSKHLVEQERQEHIKRLREQGIIIPEEELVEEKGALVSWPFLLKLCFLSLFVLTETRRKC